MAGANEDFLIGDDFDAVLALIDDDFLENDRELNQQVNEVVSEIGNHDTKQVFKCETCQNVCVSQRGLTRHQNAKHNSSASATDIKINQVHRSLHAMFSTLKNMLKLV